MQAIGDPGSGGGWCYPQLIYPQGQYLTVEQLTLDFEYVINEVIRHDATWGHQFCSFSDYDIVILEVRLGHSRRQECSYSRISVCNCHFLFQGLPRNQPGPDQHWPAALGLSSSH